MADKPEVLTTTEARAGTGTHVLRYMLIASVALAVAAMVWVFVLAPKATQDGATTAPDPVATETR
ncbi:MAG: hypothetical protein H7267_02350 [Sandarakinorhabdus sp.]|nr:hypothetical protein [Sandarakinorhabdus sp.]